VSEEERERKRDTERWREQEIVGCEKSDERMSDGREYGVRVE